MYIYIYIYILCVYIYIYTHKDILLKVNMSEGFIKRPTSHEPAMRGGMPNHHHRFPERPGVQTTKRTVRICTWLSSIDILARLAR